MSFFEGLRTALGRYAAGVHQANKPATPAELRRASERLGRELPQDYADFLKSWNGVSLFHDCVCLSAAHELHGDDHLVVPGGPPALRIGETPQGALWLCGAGEIRSFDEAAPDPIVVGSALEPFLKATLAREALLLDRDGEYRDVFDEDGEGLSLPVRRKRAALGRKHDPKAALYLFEEAELCLEGGEGAGEDGGGEDAGDDTASPVAQARALLEQACALDPHAGPAHELLSALHRNARQPGWQEHAAREALAAAAATWDPFLRASRLLDAAQLTPRESERPQHVRAAWAADPGHAQALLGEARERLQEGDLEEAEQLVARISLLLSDAPTPAEPDLAQLGEVKKALRTRSALRVV